MLEFDQRVTIRKSYLSDCRIRAFVGNLFEKKIASPINDTSRFPNSHVIEKSVFRNIAQKPISKLSNKI